MKKKYKEDLQINLSNAAPQNFIMPSLQIQPKYAKEVNQTIHEEFQENATLEQQSNPSHAEQKHQTISNLEIFVNN